MGTTDCRKTLLSFLKSLLQRMDIFILFAKKYDWFIKYLLWARPRVLSAWPDLPGLPSTVTVTETLFPPILQGRTLSTEKRKV